MAEHYTRNTETATVWCNKCNRMTEHRVDGGRLIPCMEHDTPITKKEKKALGVIGDLFEALDPKNLSEKEKPRKQ